jgi:hypothetical protein
MAWIVIGSLPTGVEPVVVATTVKFAPFVPLASTHDPEGVPIVTPAGRVGNVM